MQIHEQHLAEPGAGVLDVTVVDLETACVALDGPRQLWTASGVMPVGAWQARAGVRAGCTRQCFGVQVAARPSRSSA
ncbi:hypothetical protein ACFT8P_13225 [Streptomyces sp. NPDC057101]|uniref:hypothetical protein n=1 Tax=Streptomyces sp. NPDC057101 TaxID=3346020 RepID=UPI00363EFD90